MENEEKNKYDKFLPIGTVVLLREGKKRIMITGFCPITTNNEKKELYDYCGVMYPEGVITMENVLLFNHNQIKKIFHMGLYNDEEERIFKQKLKEEVAGNDKQ